MGTEVTEMNQYAHLATLLFFPTLLFGITVPGSAQTRVDNPARALAKDAGRTVRLEEVLRIRDDGETAIFKMPRKLALGPDGSLYFHDFAEGDRIYRYSPEGKLVFKALKSGQGPGECQHASNFFLAGDGLRIQAWSPPKVMDYGLDGRYKREIRTEDTHGLHSLFLLGGRIYGLRDEISHSQAIFREGEIVTPYSLYEISPDFVSWKKLWDFPVRHVIKNRSWVRLDMLDAAAGGPYVYVVHADAYGIDQFDLRTGRVERIFSRAYERRRIVSGKKAAVAPEETGAPKPVYTFMFDILELHVVRDRLWAFTSTRDENGDDRIVDIFDADGRFVDSIRLDFPNDGLRHGYSKGLLTNEGYYFVPEQDEDGLVSIAKYRILDASLFPNK